jgi:hypothetical protein
MAYAKHLRSKSTLRAPRTAVWAREPAWSRKRAEQASRRRLVEVEREGYVTLADFCDRWLTEYLPGRSPKAR